MRSAAITHSSSSRLQRMTSGIAELARFLGDPSPDLVRMWPQEAPARRTAWLIGHQDMRRSALIRAVSAAITEAFRRQRTTFEQGCLGKASVA